MHINWPIWLESRSKEKLPINSVTNCFISELNTIRRNECRILTKRAPNCSFESIFIFRGPFICYIFNVIIIIELTTFVDLFFPVFIYNFNLCKKKCNFYFDFSYMFNASILMLNSKNPFVLYFRKKDCI